MQSKSPNVWLPTSSQREKKEFPSMIRLESQDLWRSNLFLCPRSLPFFETLGDRTNILLPRLSPKLRIEAEVPLCLFLLSWNTV